MSSARCLRRSVGNYAPELMRLARTMTPGTVSEAIIEHDDWCRINRGRPCDCNPTVRLVPVPDPQSN